MPPLKAYKVFISHAWQYSEDYYRVEALLNAAPNFSWINLSVPEHSPADANNTEQLQRALRDQMRLANVFLIVSGMYVAHSNWIDFEINFARRIGRPIIGIVPRGSQRTPFAVQNAATEMVGWTTSSIVSTIRLHALPDGF
jgi:MTH538 TIR-like domain (DUF1863)